MTEIWQQGAQVSELPPFLVKTTSSGAGHAFTSAGFGLQDEPYLVLRGDEHPPSGTFLVDGVWALITSSDGPVAFVSPDVVAGLRHDVNVDTVLSYAQRAYIADIGEPRDFFRSRLGRPRTVSGRVFVLNRDYANRGPTFAALTEFDDAECDLGTMLPVGEICNEDCECPRRES